MIKYEFSNNENSDFIIKMLKYNQFSNLLDYDIKDNLIIYKNYNLKTVKDYLIDRIDSTQFFNFIKNILIEILNISEHMIDRNIDFNISRIFIDNNKIKFVINPEKFTNNLANLYRDILINTNFDIINFDSKIMELNNLMNDKDFNLNDALDFIRNSSSKKQIDDKLEAKKNKKLNIFSTLDNFIKIKKHSKEEKEKQTQKLNFPKKI